MYVPDGHFVWNLHTWVSCSNALSVVAPSLRHLPVLHAVHSVLVRLVPTLDLHSPAEHFLCDEHTPTLSRVVLSDGADARNLPLTQVEHFVSAVAVPFARVHCPAEHVL